MVKQFIIDKKLTSTSVTAASVYPDLIRAAERIFINGTSLKDRVVAMNVSIEDLKSGTANALSAIESVIKQQLIPPLPESERQAMYEKLLPQFYQSGPGFLAHNNLRGTLQHALMTSGCPVRLGAIEKICWDKTPEGTISVISSGQITHIEYLGSDPVVVQWPKQDGYIASALAKTIIKMEGDSLSISKPVAAIRCDNETFEQAFNTAPNPVDINLAKILIENDAVKKAERGGVFNEVYQLLKEYEAYLLKDTGGGSSKLKHIQDLIQLLTSKEQTPFGMLGEFLVKFSKVRDELGMRRIPEGDSKMAVIKRFFAENNIGKPEGQKLVECITQLTGSIYKEIAQAQRLLMDHPSENVVAAQAASKGPM